MVDWQALIIVDDARARPQDKIPRSRRDARIARACGVIRDSSCARLAVAEPAVAHPPEIERVVVLQRGRQQFRR
ncbi:hypothetical protein B0G77_0239 [Paraburkholderia sp. BL10I2N1]|nr:hypothetical protein B0G77_0239 [Paraburkholderia sp. BL10I2N1]